MLTALIPGLRLGLGCGGPGSWLADLNGGRVGGAREQEAAGCADEGLEA